MDNALRPDRSVEVDSDQIETLLVLVSRAKSIQFCLTSCNSMDFSLPVSSVHGVLQERIVEWVAISFSRGSS